MLCNPANWGTVNYFFGCIELLSHQSTSLTQELATSGLCRMHWLLLIVRSSCYEQKFFCLTGECPNVTVRYKLRRTFVTPKFDQIRPKSASFRPCFGFQISQIVLGIPQLREILTVIESIPDF